MSITFACTCGRELIAPDEMEGREIRCSLCGATHIVPKSQKAPEKREDTTSPIQPILRDNFRAPPPYAAPAPSPPLSPPLAAPPGRGGSAKLPIILAMFGIAGHLFDCFFLLGSSVLCTGLSMAALIVGWIQAANAPNPRAAINARLGAILGFFGLIAGIIYIVFLQLPVISRLLSMP